ncbi:Sucrose-6F-phosphate phosphohydrolase family protein isoform 1 [Hibiscus syriacus]|uniref:Sucrose-6F-phosphate phosphohydrolase family protein isoform 1 n=1 Tax=Hibiscus syriacus TaxID=106335 RepID=A0A6A3B4V6_HIBSY|nr:cytochrome P450 94A2-like [Hibiscus syriacus]KAE8712000.1 Sucrose-6F-phosphate phosphohydrolase family protein isoform 1 [Hibiscus syriacus]
MEMELIFSVQSLLLLSLTILCCYYYFSLHHKQNGSNHGFKIYPILGALPDFLRNRHRFLDWTNGVLRRCPTNTAVFHRPVKIHGVMTANPLNVEYALKTNFENYPKGERFIGIFKDLFGQGMFNSDGVLWKIQRKTASYEFNTKSMRNFIMDSVWLEISTRLIPVLNQASETNQILDLQDILEQFAFDNICKLAFNVDPGCLGGNGNGSHFMRAFEEATMLSFGRFMYAFPILWKIKRICNMGSERNLKKSIKIVHEFADSIIKTRLQSKYETKDEDLLSRFIRNDNNSPQFLRDIIISFILAGRDTTSSALTWFFWLLLLNPSVEQNILNELETIRTRNRKTIGCTYTFDELRDMHYLHAAISESLRLYPPVPIDTKVCVNDDILPDGTFIRKGWFFTYHAYAMGRMEAIWGKNCDEYLPERWLDETGNYKQENPFKFPIFHGGPRMCLGKDMAYIQMKSIVAAVMERFVIEVQGKDKCPQHQMSLTLRMKGGLSVKVRER